MLKTAGFVQEIDLKQEFNDSDLTNESKSDDKISELEEINQN